MKPRKNIDQLYKKTLLDAEVKPPVDAWNNIASQLPKKQEKKPALPFWYRLAGAAALLLLLITVSYKYFSPAPILQENTISSESEPNNHIKDEKQQVSGSRSQTPTLEIVSEINKSQVASKEGEIRSSTSPLKSSRDQLESSRDEKVARPDQTFRPEQQLASGTSEAKDSRPPDSTSGQNMAEPRPSATSEALSNILEKSGEQPSGDQKTALGSLLTSEDPVKVFSEDPKGRLSISTKAAPVYFNKAAGNGSREVPATGSGEASISYGIQVAYRVSKNLSLRSGLQVMDLNYSSSEVAYNAASATGLKGTEATMLLASPAVGELRQDLDFLEVPLEMEYALIDKKIKLNLIGGGSLLFLNKNELSLDSPVGVLSLQETETPNNLNFTTNVGIGLGYELFRKFELNLEPMVKFPLGSGISLSPYYFGVYSGFSYRF